MQAYAHDACMSMHHDVARQCHAGAHTTTRIYVYMHMYIYHDNYTIRAMYYLVPSRSTWALVA